MNCSFSISNFISFHSSIKNIINSNNNNIYCLIGYFLYLCVYFFIHLVFIGICQYLFHIQLNALCLSMLARCSCCDHCCQCAKAKSKKLSLTFASSIFQHFLYDFEAKKTWETTKIISDKIKWNKNGEIVKKKWKMSRKNENPFNLKGRRRSIYVKRPNK